MKKIFTFLLSPLVALIFCSCDGLDSKSSSELLQNAYSLTAERKFDKAIKYSRAVLERRPDNVDALLLLSIASEGNQDRAVALEAAQKAERIAPENFAVQYLPRNPILRSASSPRLNSALPPFFRPPEIAC